MTSSKTTTDGDLTPSHVNTVAVEKRDNMRRTLESLHSQSSSILHLALQWKDLEEHFDTIIAGIANREDKIELKMKQIEWKTKYLKKKSSDAEEKLVQVAEMMELAEERCEEFEEMCETVRRKEALLDDDIESLRCKFVRFSEYKRELRSRHRRKELDLEVRELVVDNREHDVDDRVKKLSSVERGLLERIRDVEFRERKIELKKERVEFKYENESGDGDDDGDGDGDSDDADIRFNIVMSGNDLLMFLIKRVNDHEVLRDEVTRGISLSRDPPKLVLDAIGGFYDDGFEDGEVGLGLDVVRKSCILLLEQLDELKVVIRARVRKRAVRVAMEWKERMSVGGILEVVGFLQLVVSYGLVCEFDKEELLRLFESCARHDRAVELCRSLGFTDHVRDIIRNLVLRDQPFEAIKLVYAFQLVDIFPPVPILRAHLKSAFLQAQKLYEHGDASLEVRINCINMKLSVLDSVVKCIKEYGLESKYSVQHLEHQILKLQSQKRKCNRLVSHSKAKKTIENEELGISLKGFSSSDTKTCFSTCVSPDIPVSSSASSVHSQKHPNSTGSCSSESQCLNYTSGKHPCLHAQTESKRPRLASVLVTEDSRQQSSTPTHPGFASYQCVDASTSWAYGAYNSAPLPTQTLQLIIN